MKVYGTRLAATKEQLDLQTEEFKVSMKRKDLVVKYLMNEVKRLTPKNAVGRKRFMNQSNLDVIRGNQDLLTRMCMELPPLQGVAMLTKRSLLQDFLKILNSRIDEDTLSGVQKVVFNWFANNTRQFWYKPSTVEMEAKLEENKNNFHIPVIGTIHRIPLVFKYSESHYMPVAMSIAVFDEKIVASHLCYSMDPDSAYVRMEEILSNCDWIQGYNFAISDNYPGKVGCMLPCKNRGVYLANETVSIWIENNFKYIQYPLELGQSVAVDAMYNFFTSFSA